MTTTSKTVSDTASDTASSTLSGTTFAGITSGPGSVLSSSAWRSLFPLYLTLTMAILNMASGMTSNTIHSLYNYYHPDPDPTPTQTPTLFQLNLINFIPNFVYLLIATVIPVARIFKSTLVLICFGMTVMGVMLQSMYAYHYSYLILGSILQGIPQPFILSNLLLICQDYFPEKYQAMMIGVFSSVMNMVGGLASLWCIKQMYTVDGLLQYFQLTCMYLLYIFIILSMICLLFYFIQSNVSEWNTPFITQSFSTSAKCLPTISPPSAVPTRFWVYFLIFGWMNAGAGIIDNIFEQLLVDYQLTDSEAVLALNLYLTPSIFTSFLIGICTDKIQNPTVRLWVMPCLVCGLQMLSQIGIFYCSDQSLIGLYLWIAMFSASNGTLPVVFLPTLIQLFPKTIITTMTSITHKNTNLETEGKINQYVLLWCMFCTSISVFILWREPQANIFIFGPLMIVLGCLSICLMMISFLCDNKYFVR